MDEMDIFLSSDPSDAPLACGFLINGKPYFFRGAKQRFLSLLIEAHRQSSVSRIRVVTRQQIAEVFWPAEYPTWNPLHIPPNKINYMDQILFKLRQLFPFTLQRGKTTSGDNGWFLAPGTAIARVAESPPTRITYDFPPDPKAGSRGHPHSPVLLVVLVNRKQYDLRAGAAKLFYALFHTSPHFQTAVELSFRLGLSGRRAPIDRFVIELRKQIPLLLYAGGWGKGWRIHPNQRVEILLDNIPSGEVRVDLDGNYRTPYTHPG